MVDIENYAKKKCLQNLEVRMSKKVAIVADTNCGITLDEAKKLGIYLITMPFSVDGKEYFEYKTMNHEQFFEALRNGAEVSTSMPSPADLMELWDKLLEEYDEVVHIPMSSGLSGSCHAAMGFAANYDGKVVVVDNKRVSVIMKQSILEAKHMADEGKSAIEIKKFLEDDALNASIYVAVDTLEYLKKSGRVTPAAAAIGSVLSIKPVLQIQGGKLDAYKKVRGMNQAAKAMFDGIKSDMETRFAGKDIVIRAAYSGSDEVKNLWSEAVKEAFPDRDVEVDFLPISICCHTGEGAMGIGIMEKNFANI